MTDAPLLRISNLAVEFGPKKNPLRVIEGVSFEVPVGGSIGLVGESGSGKSVSSLAAMRLIPEQSGRIAEGDIELMGRDLLAVPASEMPKIRGSEIAMIFQEPMSSLNPVMTIGDQIGEALMLHGEKDKKRRRERTIEMLRLVGIPNAEGRIGAYPHQFSGGMRQRVMIAMALSCNPRLLIADEPTTALDVTIQAQVLELMKRIRRELGTAILMISHDLGVIADICDRVVVMYAGRVVEDADIRSILTRPAHPYTRGLLRSVPRRNDTSDRLFQIPGTVPVAGTIKRGCPFRSRCELAEAQCEREMPPMFKFEGDQRAACWVTAREASAAEPEVKV
ncbi:ABC transporter ATP-binding protein [Pelagovum pacificum]|uniref:ABC transporter ATP-binding protein n=1 Tax=Pelagovum pacificum TaxID=2588711 RepID=A0A5C5GD10_9RHOB|nr:ABC transporter ATP-binding protein [Pelagovum pacificum]QQA44323.1 ABC transporter ATP-binding protein [Pelagovum pacificum]TNY32558.1 ABC transporter ATP-binding protein [Pelagovum pacificum]